MRGASELGGGGRTGDAAEDPTVEIIFINFLRSDAKSGTSPYQA
jgi:hypothetical protein